jgi:endogenous inhibitor of DNA gyrase (YacG/DUF329 family)
VKPCPICGKPAVDAFLPFCSKRCVEIDLHRWLSGGYAIPGSGEAEEDGAPDKPGGEADLPQSEEDGGQSGGDADNGGRRR